MHNHEGSTRLQQRADCIAYPCWEIHVKNGDDEGDWFVQVGGETHQGPKGLGGGDDWLAHTAGKGRVAHGLL